LSFIHDQFNRKVYREDFNSLHLALFDLSTDILLRIDWMMGNDGWME